MKYFKTPHEKKSAVITTFITALLIILFFILGLKYYDPLISFGMEVNFGNASQGIGKTQTQMPVSAKTNAKTSPKKANPKKLGFKIHTKTIALIKLPVIKHP